MPKIAYTNKKFRPESLDRIATANAIVAEYQQQGYDLTLRQLYYQHVARGLIPNSDKEYNRLGKLISDARLAGLVDWYAIVDRTRFLRAVPSWDSPAEIVRGSAGGYQRDLWEDQDVRVEVWIEKDALVGVIERACEDIRVPFLSCRGYTSQSEMWGASRRYLSYFQEGKRIVVIHLGDHDPSGIDMSRDIDERLFTFLALDHHRRKMEGSGMRVEDSIEFVRENFTLNRIALNYDQVEEYDPPPNPAKLTDSRGAGYVEKYGHESWELDALDPTVVGDLIEAAVDEHRDLDRWEAALIREERERVTLQAVSDRWQDVADFLGVDNHEGD